MRCSHVTAMMLLIKKKKKKKKNYQKDVPESQQLLQLSVPRANCYVISSYFKPFNFL